MTGHRKYGSGDVTYWCNAILSSCSSVAVTTHKKCSDENFLPRSEFFFSFTSFMEPGAIYRCPAHAVAGRRQQFCWPPASLRPAAPGPPEPAKSISSVLHCNFVVKSLAVLCNTRGCMRLHDRADANSPGQEPKIFRRIELQCKFSADDFVTKQEFFKSKDGASRSLICMRMPW